MTCSRAERVAFAASILLLVAAAGPADPAADAVARSRALQQAGDLAGAVQAADAGTAANPASAAALARRGDLLAVQFGPAAALPFYDRAVASDPRNLDALLGRATALGDMGRARDSLATARAVLTIDPANAMAFYIQALIAGRAGDWPLARRILARTGDLPDRLPAAMLLSGAADLGAGNAALATQRLGRLVELQPDNRPARMLLARALQQAGRQRDALEAIAPLDSAPDAPGYALELAARLYESLGDGAEALPLLERARAVRGSGGAPLPAPGSPEVLGGAAAAAPGDAGAVVPYVRALAASDDWAAARAAAAGLRDANPGAPDAHMLVGDAALLAGDAAAAAESYARAKAIAFTPRLALRMAELQVLAGRDDTAKALLREHLRWNPLQVDARRVLAGPVPERRSFDVTKRLDAVEALRRRPQIAAALDRLRR